MRNLLSGWEFKDLGDIAKIVGGGTPSKKIKKYYTGNIPWATIRDVQSDVIHSTQLKVSKEGLEASASNVIPKGAIILATRVGLGKVAMLDFDTAINQDLRGIILQDNNVSYQYLFQYLKSLSSYIQVSGVGSTVKGVNVQFVKKIRVPIPPLQEQQRIVATLEAVLGKIDKAITLLQQNIDSAEKLKNSSSNEIFDNTDWKKLSLKDVTSKIGSGSTPTGGHRSYKTSGISLIRSLNVYDNQFEVDGLAFIDDKQADKLSNVEIESQDVLLNITGASVARCCVVPGEILPARVNQHVCILRCTPKVLDPYFLAYMLTSPVFKHKLLDNSSGGATRESLTKAVLENFEVLCPPIEEQKRIVAYLDKLGSITAQLIQHYQSKINELKRLKKSVLQSAFKGELVSSEKFDKEVYSELGNAIEKKAKKQAVVIAMSMNEHEAIGKSLYRTKGEKSVHVIEAQTLDDFGRQPLKMAAGPADFEYLVSVVEPLATSMGWWQVKIEEREIEGKLRTTHKYVKGAKYNELLNEADIELGNKYTEAKRISTLFASLKNVRLAEVRATVYAAWNNLLIKGLNTELSDIIYEARDNWTQEKLLIPIEEFKDAILWLIQNNLEPKGQGKEVIKHLE